jgi:hypothetical protein
VHRRSPLNCNACTSPSHSTPLNHSLSGHGAARSSEDKWHENSQRASTHLPGVREKEGRERRGVTCTSGGRVNWVSHSWDDEVSENAEVPESCLFITVHGPNPHLSAPCHTYVHTPHPDSSLPSGSLSSSAPRTFYLHYRLCVSPNRATSPNTFAHIKMMHA